MAEARVLLGNLHIQVPFVAGTRAPSVARRNVTLVIINVQGEGVEVSVSKVVPCSGSCVLLLLWSSFDVSTASPRLGNTAIYGSC